MKATKQLFNLVLSIAAGVPMLAGVALAEQPGGQTPGADRSKSMQGGKAKDATTDITGGQSGIVEEYATTPVRQGKLVDEAGNKWLNQNVTNAQGKTIGKIDKVLKDKVTGDIEYAVVDFEEIDHVVPMRWSQFKEEGDHLKLNIKDEELKKAMNPTASEDLSPDVSHYMKEIEKVRKESKGHTGAQKSGAATATGQPAAGGPMGEDSTTHGGPAGPQALPPGKAPGFEGGHPSSKQ